MIHAHSLGRAARYYGERTALASDTTRPTSESFTIVLLELLQPSAGAAFKLATDWPRSSRTNAITSNWYMLVLGSELSSFR